MRILLETVLLILAMSGDALAEVGNVIRLNSESFERISIESFSFVAEDKGGKKDVHDIAAGSLRFEENKSARRMRISNSAFWLKFSIANESDDSINVILVHNIGFTSDISAYQKGSNGYEKIVSIGTSHPYFERLIKFRKPSIALSLKPGVNSFLVRIDNPATQSLMFELYGLNQFYRYATSDLAIICVITGIFIVSVLYNFILYLQWKFEYLIFYVVYCVAVYITYSVYAGTFSSVFDSIADQGDLSFVLWTCGVITLASVNKFQISYLRFKENLPWAYVFHSWLNYYYYVVLGGVILEYMLDGSGLFGALSVTAATYVTSPLSILCAILCYRKGYKPALYFLLSWSPLLYMSTVMNLVTLGIIDWFDMSDIWGLMGAGIEACLLSFAIGYRVKSERDELQNGILEHMSILDREVREKTESMRYILDNVKTGIFKINAKGMIDKEYSKSCLNLLGKKEIHGLRFANVLPDRSVIGDREMLGLNVMEMMLGESEYVYDMNSQNLIEEIQVGGSETTLRFEWVPIIHESVTSGFLVTVHDVSYLKKLEHDNKRGAEENGVLKAVSKTGIERFFEYIRAEVDRAKYARRLIDRLRECKPDNEEYVQIESSVMRDLHSIKGNSRAYGLDEISNIAHECETFIGTRNIGNVDDSRYLAEYLDLMIIKLEEYFSLAKKYVPKSKLNREQYDIDIEKMLGSISNLKKDYVISSVDVKNLNVIADFLKKEVGHTLSEVVEPILLNIKKMAEYLRKEPPGVKFSSVDFLYIKKKYYLDIQTLIVHLLRNSLDHGIENSEERFLKGKTSAGSIYIDIRRNTMGVRITYRDDGRGLAIKKIYEKGVEKGLFHKEQSPDVRMVAEQIFMSGFTSKDEGSVSIISGRGIGMEAVRDTVRKMSGEVSIQFYRSDVEEMKICEIKEDYLEFYIVIQMPSDIFV